MRLNTAQIDFGESTHSFHSHRDAWLTDLAKRISARGFDFADPLSVEFSITKLDPDYYMKGTLCCQVYQECARCAERFVMPVKQRFEIAFTRQLERRKFETVTDGNELDISLFEGNEIDLGPVVEEQFFLAIPFQSVCRPDCKGICQVCGVNCNLYVCGCKPNIQTGPFAALKSLKIQGGSRGSTQETS